jgi:hypothetical protein
MATLELSKAGVPTVCKILPLYKLIECLEKAREDLELEVDMFGLYNALDAGLSKLEVYLERALVSDYPLLGAGISYASASIDLN